jgi:hypothetical protein
VRVRFDARVVRVEERGLPGAGVGIAAMIEGYEFLRSYPLENMEENQESDIPQ